MTTSNIGTPKTNRALGMSATQHPQRPLASEGAIYASEKDSRLFRIAPARPSTRPDFET
jgi:hypothetical protein